MAHTIAIIRDAYLANRLNFLSTITGKRKDQDILAQAIAVTSDSLIKSDQGYIIRTVEQTLSGDRLSYPIRPQYLYLDMLRDRTSQGDTFEFSADEMLAEKIAIIMASLKTEKPEDAVVFAAAFGTAVAQDLQINYGIRRLAFITTFEGHSGHFGYTTRTPYDRTLGNSFNKAVSTIRHWWDTRSEPRDPSPPGPPPPYL